MIRKIPTPSHPDPLDAVGQRCQTRVGAVGKCHRRFDHVTRGDHRHWALADGQWYEYIEGEGTCLSSML